MGTMIHYGSAGVIVVELNFFLATIPFELCARFDIEKVYGKMVGLGLL